MCKMLLKNAQRRKKSCPNCKSDSHGAWSNEYPVRQKIKIMINPYYKEINEQKQEKNKNSIFGKTD